MNFHSFNERVVFVCLSFISFLNYKSVEETMSLYIFLSEFSVYQSILDGCLVFNDI